MRVGSVTPKRVDVRLVSATNRNLAVATSDGQFRADLFFRLSGVTIRNSSPLRPPRRHRTSRHPLLASRRRTLPPRSGRAHARGGPPRSTRITGPATCASCAEQSSAPSSYAAAGSSNLRTYCYPPCLCGPNESPHRPLLLPSSNPARRSPDLRELAWEPSRESASLRLSHARGATKHRRLACCGCRAALCFTSSNCTELIQAVRAETARRNNDIRPDPRESHDAPNCAPLRYFLAHSLARA